MFTFQLFNDKIYSYIYQKKPFGTWQFGKIGVLVELIIQKWKSRHLVCLSSWDMSCDPEFRILISMQKMWPYICCSELQTSIHHYFVVQLLPIFVHSNLVSQECDEKGNQLELECLRMSPKHFYATMLFGFIKIFKLQSPNNLNQFLCIYFT